MIRKLLSVRSENRLKYSVMIIKTCQINYRKILLISKYSVFIVGTRQINSIFMSKKFSSPLQVSLLPLVRLGKFSVKFLQCSLYQLYIYQPVLWGKLPEIKCETVFQRTLGVKPQQASLLTTANPRISTGPSPAIWMVEKKWIPRAMFTWIITCVKTRLSVLSIQRKYFCVLLGFAKASDFWLGEAAYITSSVTSWVDSTVHYYTLFVSLPGFCR
jgi:hypothetical protein